MNIGLWHITNNKLKLIGSSNVELEKNLEEWIEKDPSLIQEGLTIVSRQKTIEGVTPDLLAVDSQGRIVVIEIKRDNIRRKTIAQAIDYASIIHYMDEEDLKKSIIDYLNSKNESLPEMQNTEDILNSIGEKLRETKMWIEQK